MTERSELMIKVLVTGSAGFAGKHLIDHLIQKTDWKIIGIDSFRHRGDSERIIGKHKDRYEIHLTDLNAPLSKRLIRKIGTVDYILNLASESHVDRSITDPVSFFQNNVNVALHMLDAARELEPKKFIQISTDEVYGPALESHDHKEWEAILPSNPYSASKAAQESAAISFWRTYGVPVYITNTMNMFGEMQDAEKFIPLCISRILKGECVTIHGRGDYIGTRKYLHARNHADALLFLLQNVEPEKYLDSLEFVSKPHRFNVVGDIELDNLSLAQMIAGILNRDLIFELQDFHAITTRPGHDRRYSLDGSKLKNFGWKAPIEFEKSLETTIKWYLSNKEWLA